MIRPLDPRQTTSRRRSIFFFFNDTATTEIYTLSLHDALPISRSQRLKHRALPGGCGAHPGAASACGGTRDRKSTRLNSSHVRISYAVFCLKKKTSASGERQEDSLGSRPWTVRRCTDIGRLYVM